MEDGDRPAPPAPSGWRRIASVFDFTAEERLFLAAVVAIFLLGLAARYAWLRSRRPEPNRPDGVERIDQP
jgi:hypothetical protein